MVKDFYAADLAHRDGVYFSHPGVAVVKWNWTVKAVHIEWQGWADSTEFMALNEAGLLALVEHHGSRFLSDSRQMKVVKQSDQDWLSGDLFPRALAAGLRHVAVVIPTSALAAMNIDHIAARVADDQLAIAHFATIETAAVWLTQTPTLRTAA
jgi:hypothetical protein